MLEDGKRVALAVDIGGTKILVALVSEAGDIISQENYLTLADEGVEAVIDRLLTAVNHALGKAKMESWQLSGLCVAIAGVLDARRGVVTLSPNLRGWHNVPLGDIVAERLSVEAYIINDASAAALGEYLLGAGVGVNNLIYVTVSTGIGGGIILNGKLYLGADGCAGEVGHMVVDANGPRCKCGNIGCLEAFASGTAVAREAVRRISRGEKSRMTELVGDRLEDIDASIVGVAAKEGDVLACDIIEKAADYLGIGLANLANIFNPELIIVGGGMSRLGDMLLEPARRVVRERAFQLPARSLRIVPSQLGDNAGVLGAAMYVFQSAGRSL